MQDVEYYQVGGFQSRQTREDRVLPQHRDAPLLHGDPNDVLASKLMHMNQGPGVDMVLGIKRNGATCILLPRAYQDHRRDLKVKLQRVRKANEYESLSPIHFSTEKELADKLKSLTSKPVPKGKRGDPDLLRDRSRANTEYTAGGDRRSEAGTIRSSFEHQRVFYALCQNDTKVENRVDYALNLATECPNVRIFSFAFNLWALDSRNLHERKTNPTVLDVGWTDFNSPSEEGDLEAVATTHMSVEENQMFKNPRKQRMTLPGITQVMNRTSIERVLQSVFAASNGERAQPKLLLVYDEEWARCVFRSFGVDTSEWQVGIKNLLYSPHRGVDQERYNHQDGRRDPRDYRGRYERERSRSPRRPIKDEPSMAPRARSPPPQPSASSVYMVDVRKLYQYLMQDRSRDNTTLSIGEELFVKDVKPERNEQGDVEYVDVNPNEWCAGRDSRLLGFLWEAMATGLSIDEQRVFRLKKDPIVLPEGSHAGTSGQVDEDVDPNDLVQPQPRAQAAPPKRSKPVGMFDSEEEDDDW